METLLVLTDFSEEAKHAAEYAAILAQQLHSKNIVLYHSYQLPVVFSEGALLVTEDDPLEEESLRQLSELENELKKNITKNVTIRNRTDTIALGDINTVAEQEGAAMIVMGTAGKTKLEEVILGSAAITVCKNSECPVVLVPAGAELQPVKHIAFACDLKEVEKTIPVTTLKMMFNEFKVPLAVVNVSEDDEYFAPETRTNSLVLHDMLKEYSPSYYNSSTNNVLEGIVEFTEQYTAALILLISKRHNFMEGLFYKSLTRKLVHQTPFPLLVIRENQY